MCLEKILFNIDILVDGLLVGVDGIVFIWIVVLYEVKGIDKIEVDCIDVYCKILNYNF